MSILYFCRDGILRKRISSGMMGREGPEAPLLSLKDFTESLFLGSIHDAIDLEEGITLREIFENLSPWPDIMSGIACMDFPAFLDEIRSKTDTRFDDGQEIRLEFVAELSAAPKFKEPFLVETDSKIEISDPVFTGKVDIESFWVMSAMLKPEARHEYHGSDSVSLSFTPLPEWGHLPVRVSQNAVLYDRTGEGSQLVFLGHNAAITSPDHPNVKVTSTSAHEIAIRVPQPTFFHTLLRGLLWDVGFHYSPTERDSVAEDVFAQAAAFDSGEAP